MDKIANIHAREILDSRGHPTIEVDVTLQNGMMGRAAVPSGVSVGSNEALELRDLHDSRYMHRGVQRAVANVNDIIAKALIGTSVLNQRIIDSMLLELDSTKNKSTLGANAILGVSLAVAHAAAKFLHLPLYSYIGGIDANTMPVPMMNLINGGAHSDSGLDIQEFMIVPMGAPNFTEAVRMGSEIFHHLKAILKDKGMSITLGDEGGFAPKISNTEEALDILCQAISDANYKLGREVFLALDVAASEFYENGQYHLKGSGGGVFDSDQMISFYEKLITDYPIISLEDPMSEHDEEGWKNLTSILWDRVQLVGDDLFVTNPEILSKGIASNIANSVLIKVNQIGTLTETIETVNIAKNSGYNVIISHRSGETEDTTIAHLAVGLGSQMIKTGSVARSERVAKYNELMRIEEGMRGHSKYMGTILKVDKLVRSFKAGPLLTNY